MLKNLSTPRFHDAEFVAFISEYSHGRKLISTKWDPCCRVVMNSELLDDGPGFCNGTTTLVEHWIPFKEFEVPPFQSVSAIGTTGKKKLGFLILSYPSPRYYDSKYLNDKKNRQCLAKETHYRLTQVSIPPSHPSFHPSWLATTK